MVPNRSNVAEPMSKRLLFILHFTSFVTTYTNKYISVKLLCAFLHLHYKPPGQSIEQNVVHLVYCGGTAVGIDVPQYTPFYTVPYFTTFLSLHFVGLVGKFLQNNSIQLEVMFIWNKFMGPKFPFLNFFYVVISVGLFSGHLLWPIFLFYHRYYFRCGKYEFKCLPKHLSTPRLDE